MDDHPPTSSQALVAAMATLRVAETLRNGEDEAVSALFAVEDRILESRDERISSLLIQDSIRLRRLIVAAAEEDEARELRLVSDDIDRVGSGVQKLAMATAMLFGLAARYREALVSGHGPGGLTKQQRERIEEARWVAMLMAYATDAVAAAGTCSPGSMTH